MKFAIAFAALLISMSVSNAQPIKFKGNWHWTVPWVNEMNKGNTSTLEIDFGKSFGSGKYCYNTDCRDIIYTLKQQKHAWFSTDTVNRFEVWQTQPGKVLHGRFWVKYQAGKNADAVVIFER